MLRKRLIFTLIYCDGFFMQSRNFSLQKVGNIDWLNENYQFKKKSFSIDELIILDVSRDKKMTDNFLSVVENLAMGCFIPISVGGGIDSLQKCKLLFSKGADKLIINSALKNDKSLSQKIKLYYGSQSIIASVDVKKINGEYYVFTENGKKKSESNFKNYLLYLESIGVGEIYLNSIDRDGTGFGYDFELIQFINEKYSLPIIMAGGAGNYQHFVDALREEKIHAASTANLFNFMGDGLADARKKVISNKINLSNWENYD